MLKSRRVAPPKVVPTHDASLPQDLVLAREESLLDRVLKRLQEMPYMEAAYLTAYAIAVSAGDGTALHNLLAELFKHLALLFANTASPAPFNAADFIAVVTLVSPVTSEEASASQL